MLLYLSPNPHMSNLDGVKVVVRIRQLRVWALKRVIFLLECLLGGRCDCSRLLDPLDRFLREVCRRLGLGCHHLELGDVHCRALLSKGTLRHGVLVDMVGLPRLRTDVDGLVLLRLRAPVDEGLRILRLIHY